jgi:hypothetical protein
VGGLSKCRLRKRGEPGYHGFHVTRKKLMHGKTGMRPVHSKYQSLDPPTSQEVIRNTSTVADVTAVLHEQGGDAAKLAKIMKVLHTWEAGKLDTTLITVKRYSTEMMSQRRKNYRKC